MMKQALRFTFLILVTALASLAQTTEQQVTKIRAICGQTNNRIEAGLKDNAAGLHYATWVIGGERDGQQWAAVGTMKSAVEFYFDGEPNAGEETIDMRKTVRKIVSKNSVLTEPRSISEYCFDDKTGALIFAYTIDYTDGSKEGAKLERRFYYAKGKLTRVVSDGKNIDRNIGNEYAQLAANAQADARRLQNIFALIFAED